MIYLLISIIGFYAKIKRNVGKILVKLRKIENKIDATTKGNSVY